MPLSRFRFGCWRGLVFIRLIKRDGEKIGWQQNREKRMEIRRLSVTFNNVQQDRQTDRQTQSTVLGAVMIVWNEYRSHTRSWLARAKCVLPYKLCIYISNGRHTNTEGRMKKKLMMLFCCKKVDVTFYNRIVTKVDWLLLKAFIVFSNLGG